MVKMTGASFMKNIGINAKMLNMMYHYVRLSTVRLHLVVWYTHWNWQYNLQLTTVMLTIINGRLKKKSYKHDRNEHLEKK